MLTFERAPSSKAAPSPVVRMPAPASTAATTKSAPRPPPPAALLPGEKNTSWRFAPDTPFLDALATCETFKCLKEAHLQPRGVAKFNFPHFMIAGYSKSATTSLYQ